MNSNPIDMFEYNGKLYFEANDGYHGYELWEVDDSGIPRMISDISPGSGGSYPAVVGVFQGKMIFLAQENISENDFMWLYDGTGLPIKADEYYHQSFKGLYFRKIFNNKIYTHYSLIIAACPLSLVPCPLSLLSP